MFHPRHPVPHEGRSRSSRTLERDAVGAGASGATISQGGLLRERLSSAQTNGADPPSRKFRRDWYQACRAAFAKGVADGEVVWSWHPLLVSSLAEVLSAQPGARSHSIRGAMVAKRNSSPRRARRKPLKPFACGNAG